MQAYRIRDWNGHFENNKSRERDECSWCPIPNKQDGLGYGLLMERENGVGLYGAFVSVVLVASKQKKPRNGLLTDTGQPTGCPLSARMLSVKTRVPEGVIFEMLEACLSIGWIEVCEINGSRVSVAVRQVPIECPPKAPEEKGIEENLTGGSSLNVKRKGVIPPVTASPIPPVEKCDFEKITVPRVTDYSELAEIGFTNPVLAAMAATNERDKTGWGYWVRFLTKQRKALGRRRADELFMRSVEMAYGEIRQGEADKPGAILNKRLEEFFPKKAA